MFDRTMRAGVLLTMLCSQAQGGEVSTDYEDRQAIGTQLAEYAYRWDRKDAEAFTELFAEDGGIDWVLGGEPAERSLVGRPTILAYARNAHAERIGERQSRHHFTSLVFRELSADRAVTENMMLVTHQPPGGTLEVMSSGYYRIAWTKIDGEWLIAQRTLYVDR